MLTTPGGTPASRRSAPSLSVVPEVSSLGLTTAQQPTARAKGSFWLDDQERVVPGRDHPDDAHGCRKTRPIELGAELVVGVAVGMAGERRRVFP